MLWAARSFSQPRPISRFGAALAGHIGLGFHTLSAPPSARIHSPAPRATRCRKHPCPASPDAPSVRPPVVPTVRGTYGTSAQVLVRVPGA